MFFHRGTHLLAHGMHVICVVQPVDRHANALMRCEGVLSRVQLFHIEMEATIAAVHDQVDLA